ncbi:ATP synthase subunit alpha [Cryptotermes secundus]|uniref:ATP synthase subunit alpha n=1 Tax=Cryptotermes secundus TaxID=105785 RepID=A0A2J7PFB0_9NEOP|nr:ATP synthase subunit alpha [Cryptotermes secundus]
MPLNPHEISELIKQRIAKLDIHSEFSHQGNIVSVYDGIIRIYGLSEVMQGEVLQLPGERYALALNLERDTVGAVVMGPYSDLTEGMAVYSTGRMLEALVGEGLLGRVLNVLGQPIDGKGELEHDGTAAVEVIAPGVIERQSVDKPLQTGYKAIDAMVPIGRGQRELIIGDRQTGKTALAVDTMINQCHFGVKCIYVAIGQKASTVSEVVRQLEEHDALAHTIVVVASAAESAVLQYLAPYVGCTMGEYFRDRGEDALIVYDDLSKQSVAYRQISLLLRCPPGREAFPGDIFYIHSRLLERAARVNADYVERFTQGKVTGKSGSLTALPIIETQAGDVSAFVPTNVISITDGQIFLENEVTRKQLAHGEVTELLKQARYQPLSIAEQALLLFAVAHNHLDDIPVETIQNFEHELLSYAKREYLQFINELNASGNYDKRIEKYLKQILDAFKANHPGSEA